MGIFPNASGLRVLYGIQLLFSLFAVKQYFSCEEIPEKGDSRCDQFCDDLEQRCLVGKQLLKKLRDADRDQQTDNTDRRKTQKRKPADKAIPEKLNQRILGIPDKELFQFSFLQISRTSFSASFMLILL